MFNNNRKTLHQMRVEIFMTKAKQNVPDKPTIPDADTRVLRAKLIMEECLETIWALGVEIEVTDYLDEELNIFLDKNNKLTIHPLSEDYVNLIEIADGCADIKVVTTGTLSAFGIPDEVLQDLVDLNNLDKFGPGHMIREDGKLIKPPNHTPPKIKELLKSLEGNTNDE